MQSSFRLAPPDEMPEEGEVVRLERAGLRYPGAGRDALCETDLMLRQGAFCFVVGDSGAGKTSLLHVIGLALPPTRGRIALFGRRVDRLGRPELAALRRRIGLVFQDFRLLEHLSAFDNVALPLRIGGADEGEIAAFVSELLAWLGLGESVEARADSLSVGQRQLVAIARAVVTRPALLLADEPTSNVDVDRVQRLMFLFDQLARLGTTVLLATHNQELIASHPHPALRMADGMLSVEPRTLQAAE
jgi:cell division transport system ATP-binding protein